jgi:formylglycine-generating enzyme
MKSSRKITATAPTRPMPPPGYGQGFRALYRSLFLATVGAIAFLVVFFATRLHQNAPMGEAPPGMVWIPGGEFTMGTDAKMAWQEEKPSHRVRVDGFWMDATEVTNAQFQEFVDATGYVTTAEKPPSVEEILKQSPPGTPAPPAENLVPGSLVFRATKQPVKNFRDYSQWWQWTPGANWRHPDGPTSDIVGRQSYPVVHVSWDDAIAYAKWANKRLPTEAEWEFAARGGLDNKRYVWGDTPFSSEHPQCNIWEGEFPWKDTGEDGFKGLAPAKSFAPNGYGLYDMAGNAWEWCADWYDWSLYQDRAGKGVVINPDGPARTNHPEDKFAPRRVQRGGSYLCCDNYCTRYRPSARQGCPPDTGMSHVGFRCVRSADGASRK